MGHVHGSSTVCTRYILKIPSKNEPLNAPAAKLLQFSPWGPSYEGLRAFMDTISVAGGLGREAIEIGFWHSPRLYLLVGAIGRRHPIAPPW